MKITSIEYNYEANDPYEFHVFGTYESEQEKSEIERIIPKLKRDLCGVFFKNQIVKDCSSEISILSSGDKSFCLRVSFSFNEVDSSSIEEKFSDIPGVESVKVVSKDQSGFKIKSKFKVDASNKDRVLKRNESEIIGFLTEYQDNILSVNATFSDKPSIENGELSYNVVFYFVLNKAGVTKNIEDILGFYF